MKTIVIAANFAILVAMAVVYTNHVHATETDRLLMQIEIEKTVAQALLGDQT